MLSGRIDGLLQRLVRDEIIAPIAGTRRVYRLVVPFADALPASEELIVQECDPFAVFGHFTAMAHHGLTVEFPRLISATSFDGGARVRTPLGTTPEDWLDLPTPVTRQPTRIEGTPVRWTRTKATWDFGHLVSHSAGLPIYVTDVERTLIDSLRDPGKCGGIVNVFRAWRRAADRWNLDRLVEHVDRFDSPIVRQRVGFMLDTLGASHPRMDDWRSRLQRGGSLRLVAGEPYSPNYSERWNLSINVPQTVLGEIEAA